MKGWPFYCRRGSDTVTDFVLVYLRRKANEGWPRKPKLEQILLLDLLFSCYSKRYDFSESRVPHMQAASHQGEVYRSPVFYDCC